MCFPYPDVDPTLIKLTVGAKPVVIAKFALISNLPYSPRAKCPCIIISYISVTKLILISIDAVIF